MRNALSGIASVGRNLLEGLWNGISDAWGWVKGKIESIAGSILDTVKGIFGIHSPSREMAFVGQMLDQGLANGIADSTRPIQNAIDGVTGMVAGGIPGQIGMDVTASGSYAGGQYNEAGLLLGAVQALSAKLDSLQVVMDSGELVGAISPKIDGSLGTRSRMAQRGLAV